MIIAPGEKVFGALLAIAGVGIILTGHWATTDDMIADLIAGGLMLAFGILVLLMWSFRNAAPARQGNRRLLHRPRRQRAGAGLRLFQGGAGRRAASAIFKLVEAEDCGRVSDSTSQSLSLCRPAS